MHRQVRIYIIVTVLIAVFVFGAYWIQHYLQRSRASATAPTAAFSIAGPKVNPGDSFDLILSINPNLTPFYAFDLAFTYDPAKVSVKITDPTKIDGTITPLSPQGGSASDITLLEGVSNTHIDTGGHTIRITGLRTNGAQDPFMGRDPIQFVKVSFVMNTDAALPLDFNWVDPNPAEINGSDSFEKINLHYTGEQPTAVPTSTGIPAVGVPTTKPTPEIMPPTGTYNSLTPVPTIMGSTGEEGATLPIFQRNDLLYINSIASYQSPFRYEQALQLAKGTYSLRFGAKIYVRKGRGVVVAIVCNDTKCGVKNKGQMMYVSSVFPVKTEFSELVDSFTIPDDADNKQYILRVFCEDGSECELDYISLEDAWGSQLVKNDNFQEVTQMSDPRKQPQSWEVDSTANLYGSVDTAFGVNGALMINNSAK